MNLKMHSTTGKSFRGVMEYLTDAMKAPEESRVAWVETQNLGTGDAMTASKVMAATWYNQKSLKAETGISNAGRPAKGGPVMHFSLSWREDEVEKGISKQAMLLAAHKTLSVLGSDTTKMRGKNQPKHGGRRQFADEHQVVILCHNDKHPHVHVVVNRVQGRSWARKRRQSPIAAKKL